MGPSLSQLPPHDLSVIAMAARATARFPFIQTAAPSDAVGTLSGQVANTVVSQIVLNLQLNTAVSFTTGYGL